jgi:hypothetical protein
MQLCAGVVYLGETWFEYCCQWWWWCVLCTTAEYEKLLACAVRLEGYLIHTEPIPSSVRKRLVSQWMAVLSCAGALDCED